MVHYDPFAYDTHEHPYPIYRQLRDEAPAYYNAQLDFWALSRYDDVRNALIDHETFCSGQGFLLEDIGELALPMVLGMDPPDHTRLRGTINRALTPRRVAALEAPIRRLARALLDAFAPAGRGDIVADFAAIVPMNIISELLCVPHADRDQLRTWADEMVERADGVKGLPPQAVAAGGKIVAYFDALLQRRAAAPADDLLSLLIAAEQRQRAESLGAARLLFSADHRRQRDDHQADRQHDLSPQPPPGAAPAPASTIRR